VHPEYAASFDAMVAESLIRALELRMDRAPAAVTQEAIRTHYRTGLLLTPYFFSALADYEVKETPLRDEVENLVKGINIASEQTRFRETFHAIALPERPALRAEVPEAPKANPMMELLLAGEAAFANDKPRARAAFERVLREYDPNSASALYGIALIEMDNGRVDEASLDKALQYFERTIKSDSATKEMKTWSHIHMGHIFDFKCQRQAAIDNYKKALEIGDNSKNAQGTAERDLAKPFGGECRQ
jgi:tetratricopeptide (TPR) repeat protein